MALEYTITTDHKWKPFKGDHEVSKSVLASDFDYQDRDEVRDGFFRYRKCWYHLDQFMRLSHNHANGKNPFAGWHGYYGDSYSSGVLIKLSNDGESYQVATYCC